MDTSDTEQDQEPTSTATSPTMERFAKEYREALETARAVGYDEGRIDGRADMLMLIIITRFPDAPGTGDALLRAYGADHDTLIRWVERAITAATIDEVFEE